MGESVVEQVRNANTKLHSFVSLMRISLAGRSNFNVEDIRAIGEPVGSIQPIIDDVDGLRTMHPDLDEELEEYKGNLEQIKVALEQMRVMLVGRRAHVEAARGHLATLGMWNAALRLTR